MVNYPKSLPTDAAAIVVKAATNGFAPDGEHGDRACVVQACWNLLGYGLSVWLPHYHPDIKAAKKGAMPVSVAALPRKTGGQLAMLSSLVAPAAMKKGAALPDLSKLPWDQIVALAILIIQSLLKK